MDKHQNLPGISAPLGRPRTSGLSRKEQLVQAQQRRREKLRSSGLARIELFVDQDTIAKLARMTGERGIDQSAAVILAVAKYDDRSSGLPGLPMQLADDLEKLFPSLDLAGALFDAASKHVAEVRRKRASSSRSKGKKVL